MQFLFFCVKIVSKSQRSQCSRVLEVDRTLGMRCEGRQKEDGNITTFTSQKCLNSKPHTHLRKGPLVLCIVQGKMIAIVVRGCGFPVCPHSVPAVLLHSPTHFHRGTLRQYATRDLNDVKFTHLNKTPGIESSLRLPSIACITSLPKQTYKCEHHLKIRYCKGS